MNVYLKGLGAIGPGFANWAELGNLLASSEIPSFGVVPHPQGIILPGTERRRASPTIKLALDVALQAIQVSGLDADKVALVFASSNGDTDTIHHICETLATLERFVSPTRFHNSVHNAAAGYWSIASRSMQPSTSLCAGSGTFSAALLEGATQCISEEVPVLISVFDTAFPDPLYDITPVHKAFGVAMVLDENPGNAIAQFSIELSQEEPDTLSGWETVRTDASAARVLPLLATIAKGKGTVVLEYLEDLGLKVSVTS